MITVDKSKRYLELDHKFFPYLADTAWTLPHKLDRQEILFYLETRKRQGFRAVQVCALCEQDGLRVPNKEGNLPFFEQNPEKPNEAYFSLLLFVADECAKRDMALVLLPTWGDKFNRKWGIGPEVFTPKNAFVYGQYLAKLFGKREQLIWMLGGDRPLETAYHREIIDEMARGLRKGEAVRHLMTYHPCGESCSADFLADAPYLDFHSLQSGHSFGGFQSDRMVQKAKVQTGLPVLDAECFYEDFPIGFDLAWQYRFSAADIRKRIYRNLMAGALGHTYGHQSVWCFRESADEEYPFDWKTALTRPMAGQMRYINDLIAAAEIWRSRESGAAKNAPARETEDHLVIYAENAPVFVDNGAFLAAGLRWFDPETGIFTDRQKVTAGPLTLYNPLGHEAIALLEK